MWCSSWLQTSGSSRQVEYIASVCPGKATTSCDQDRGSEASFALQKRFGNCYVVGTTFINKYEKWPKIVPKDASVTQLCITCFVAPTYYYHIIARTFVYFTPLHTLYTFSDCNTLNIQFSTCNRDVNMVAAVIFFPPSQHLDGLTIFLIVKPSKWLPFKWLPIDFNHGFKHSFSRF